MSPAERLSRRLPCGLPPAGKSTIGIPQSVGKDFVRADKGKKSFKGKGKKKS